jgi:hypothetical protein
LLPFVVLTALVAVVPGPDPAGAADDATGTLGRIASCLNTNRRLLIAVLVDESGSLRTTDPTNERVAAAKLALSTFAALGTARPGDTRTPRIEVAVFGFSSALRPAVDWSRLNDRSLARISRAIDGFAERDDGIDTDFPTALSEAQRNIAARSAALSETGGRAVCKVVLLFTDGKYDIEVGDSAARREAGTTKEYAPNLSLLDPGNKEAVERAGRELLCRTDGGGLADRLRADGVITVTIALAAQISEAEQRFLRALSSGDGGAGVTCGRRRGAAAGTYVSAASLPELVPAFNRVATTIGGGVPAPRRTVERSCTGRSCVRATRDFDIEAGIGRFTMLGEADAGGMRVVLVEPNGGEREIASGRDGRSLLGGADVRWRWVSPTAVSVDATASGRSGWIGRWRVRFVDESGEHASARPRADVSLYGDWLPKLGSARRMLLGEPTTIAVDVVDEKGLRVDPGREGASYELGASVRDPVTGRMSPVALERRGSGRAVGHYTAAKSTKSSSLDVVLRLEVRTASGLQLAPRELTVKLPVAAPRLYPQLLDTELRLSSVRGTGGAEGTLRVKGGRDRDGCVWFDRLRVEAFPPEAEGFTSHFPATARDGCVALEPGSTRPLDIRIENAASATGTVRGTIDVLRVAEGEPAVLRTSVPFSFDLAPPINQTERTGLFLAIFVPGVALPVIGLVIANRRLARFEPGSDLIVASIPVAVEQRLSTVMRVHVRGEDAGLTLRRVAPDGREGPLVFSRSDFGPLAERRERAQVVRFRDLEWRARAPGNPFGVPYGTVVSSRPCTGGGVDVEPHSMRLPLSLAGTWVFVYEPAVGADPEARSAIRGELVVVLADGDFDAELAPVLATLETHLPGAAMEAQALVPA